MEDCTASVPEEVVLEVMPVSSNFSDYKDTFTPCKPFPSREAAISWLQMISGENKFVLVTKRSDAGGIKHRGMVKLACERSGTYRGLAQRVGKGKAAKILKKSRNDEKARTPTSTKKCGCPFLINVKENADSLWSVTVICGRHNHDTAEDWIRGSRKLRMRGGTEIQQLREISPPSSFVECEQKVEDAGRRTPGSPIGFESSHSTKEASTSRQKKGKVVPQMRRASRRTQSGSNMAYGHCLESDWLLHVEGIIDVVSNGNCGYRCIASGLGFADVDGWRIVHRRMYDEIIGYEDLWREVLGSSFETVKNAVHCPEKQVGVSFKEWLTLPDMRLLVSTAFNVILVNLSHGSASTFLPLRSAPPSSLHNRLIIAMTNERNIHWVRVSSMIFCELFCFPLNWVCDNIFYVLLFTLTSEVACECTVTILISIVGLVR
ncbi:hypothetical protein Syun_003660 [Stephania yunnanensis]|uniref:FAR1 domain-containing protein n=1 Tax=Stephania yunnanensis TaxID=152371 RepID=A0AAP0Q0F2_9MAGN